MIGDGRAWPTEGVFYCECVRVQSGGLTNTTSYIMRELPSLPSETKQKLHGKLGTMGRNWETCDERSVGGNTQWLSYSGKRESGGIQIETV